MNALNLNLNLLAGLGSIYGKKLNRLNLFTLFDLLTYAPRVYEARKKVVAIQQIVAGEKNAVIGKVLDVRVQSRRMQMLLVTLADETGLLSLRFFRFYPSQIKQFEVGKWVYAFGETQQIGVNYEMNHPDYQIIDTATAPLKHAFALYPLSEGLSQNRLHTFIENAFKWFKGKYPPENLPREIVQQFGLSDFWESLFFIHFPPETAHFEQLNARTHPTQKRLIFEELLAHRLALKQPEDNTEAQPLQVDPKAVTQFLASLPFVLTAGQHQALTEILADLQQTVPMQRLLQGDVGSGKTIVAFVSAFVVIQNGQQVVLMAPTEILAEQLYLKAQEIATPFGVRVLSLLGKLSAKIKKEAYQQIESGVAEFIIGTHALIQEKVRFANLGLIIIDEQHRFGVGQRLQLQQKGQAGEKVPHQLIMSATPIPRTLAMTLYADLAISNIYEMPQGRKPIETVLIADVRRDEIIQRLKKACAVGEQIYWICPLIAESEKLALEAAESTFDYLNQALAGVAIALLHGRMKGSEKSAIMHDFKMAKIQILVATTVVEVGVDVPNASIMIIENPERMGLSQLHQLRGRVGRGQKQSFCVLLYHPPLNETSMARLTSLRQSQSGFDLAEKDLEIRGAGEFLGTRQTGGVEFRFASLIRDQALLQSVHQAAEIMLSRYPQESKHLVQKWFSRGIEFVKV